MWRSKYILVTFFIVGTLILLAGCSSGSSGGGDAGSSGGSGGDSSESSSGSAQRKAEKTSAPPETTQISGEKPSGSSYASSSKNSGGKEKAGKRKKNPAGAAVGYPARIPAFVGLKKADKVAKKWNEDARLYAIASVSPEVDAEGRSAGWLYSYVSESGTGIALISVEKGKATLRQEPPAPAGQVRQISERALPSSGKLIDSPEAMGKAGKVKKFIRENPGSQVSAGLDSFSTGKPTWILATLSEGGRVEEKVPATS